MPSTQIRLLGRFEARKPNGSPVSPPGRQSIALLACLASPARAPTTRQELASLIWSDRGREQAIASLRQEFMRLRKTFGPDAIINADQVGGGAPSLNPELIDVDLVDFERAADKFESHRATSLYRGPLLADFPIRERDAFTNWLQEERGRIAGEAARVLLRTLRGAEADVAIAKRILEIDPRCEEAWRFLIHAHAAKGEASALEDAYESCVRAMAVGGARPSAETVSLVELARAELAVSVISQFRHASADLQPRAIDLMREGLAKTVSQPANVEMHAVLPIIEDRPSLAVMPLDDLGHESRTSFARALTDDITQALCRVPGFFVTARQSAEAIATEVRDARAAARALGVRYLIEGSVEHDRDAVRANIRLIDGVTGMHLWGERIEAPGGTGLALRDPIVHAIAGRLQPRLITAEIERAIYRKPVNDNAWDLMMRAAGLVHSSFRPGGDVMQPVVLLERAIEIDPQSGMAHAMLSSVLTFQSLFRVGPGRLSRRWRARRHMERALQLDPENTFVLSACADTALYMLGDMDRAIAFAEAAIRNDPNDPSALAMLGHLRRMAGESPQGALALIAQALRLSPRDPRTGIWLHFESWCHWKAGDYAAMEQSARRSLEVYRDFPWSWVALTCALGLQERWREAQAAGMVLRDLMPRFSGFVFFVLARIMYGRRFVGETREGYRQLRIVLDRAMAKPS